LIDPKDHRKGWAFDARRGDCSGFTLRIFSSPERAKSMNPRSMFRPVNRLDKQEARSHVIPSFVANGEEERRDYCPS
jgi:hypothetical protein